MEDALEWIFELFDEIEKPTLRNRAQLFSLLLAEAESWSNEQNASSCSSWSAPMNSLGKTEFSSLAN